MGSTADDSVIDLYQNHFASWIRLRGTELMEKPWLDAFLDILPQERPDVLDLGCGSGIPIASYLIEKECSITGVDGASALIECARKHFPEQTWLVNDMRALPELGQFAGLVAWHSLFHLRPEDQRPMFHALRRLAAPSAALLFTTGTTEGEVIGSFEGQPLYHGSLNIAEYQELLQENGFETIRHVESDPTCGGATIWLAMQTGKGN